MDWRHLVDEIARSLGSEPPGTRLTVWSDCTLTRSCGANNPVVAPGAAAGPLAFFVAGIDRPNHEAIYVRLQRALGSVPAA
ncbi:MAG: hypothetical protein U5Q44_02595 [Dehalococcoidia bacterium]|nr:hypothetical protein [Dehalococcoidia bacterium]